MNVAVEKFFGDEAPEMVFNPNLFTPYSVDFVRIVNRIVTISSKPDTESMLHETFHTAVARYRKEITKFAEVYGLASFAQPDKMMESLTLTITRDGMTMVTHKKANKSLAVAELARLWCIEPCEIAAFGDDRNDLELLSFAGLGIAMKQRS